MTDSFVADLIDEEADAAAAFAGREAEFERPEEATLDPELGLYWRAWQALRHDRHFGALGGVGRIYFTAIDRYATRYCISGAEFDIFLALIAAMDDEYCDWEAKRAKEDAERRKEDRR